MVFFTSDLHLGHANIIRLCNRPFSSIEEMDATIINNWNKCVHKSDTVYVLGDFTMIKDVAIVENYINQLNGKIYFLRGNHDYWMKNYDFSKNDRIFNLGAYHEEALSQRRFILCHYPFEEWNHFYRGAYHLHGHQHNTKEYNIDNIQNGFKRFDVGVDANNFTPVSIDRILQLFKDNTISVVSIQ